MGADESCELVIDALVSEYTTQHPWVTIETVVYNDDVVRQKLQAGEVDIALLTASDEQPAGDWWETAWYRDGIAVIVNPSTPVEETGMVFLREIYQGRVQEWEGVVLTVVIRESGSGLRSTFDRLVLGTQEATLMAVVMPSSRGVIDFVGSNPGAIGYISTLQLEPEDLETVRLMSVDGVFPEPSMANNGGYPLVRQLVVAASGEPSGEVREFAQWLVGSSGQLMANRYAGW
jgi:ABC-type phosphate transport system substrate-binding protein